MAEAAEATGPVRMVRVLECSWEEGGRYDLDLECVGRNVLTGSLVALPSCDSDCSRNTDGAGLV